ncbi:hypothetical protein DFH08DRAFT_883520 [Mycena albidolilacea]|uniref:Uncharacterized protein n=1 Tax=Mycena albidolilacea TaxID=1033008 RepID=A0AAD7EKI0_9AGAR|nr:hypothetical protein DFH08DRAFT_883520 [Mycena albidolilacea]
METDAYKWCRFGGLFHITPLLTTHRNLTTMSDTTISGSKSKQVSITTRHTPRQSQKQRNYAITCGGIVVVLKTQVAGSLYIITGDGKRKCIEINIDDASVGKARRAGDKGTGNINVTATVRTLYVDGGPVEDEETEVKVEELQDDEETLDALSGLQRTSAATTPTPETHTAENTTQLSATNTPIVASVLPVTQTKRRIEPTSPSTPAASQPSTSHTSSSSTVAAATQTRSMRRDTKAGAAMPPTAPASPSPKKRSATEMESSDAVQGPSALVNGGSKKRVKVAEEKPPRSPPRRGRVSDFQT